MWVWLPKEQSNDNAHILGRLGLVSIRDLKACLKIVLRQEIDYSFNFNNNYS